MMGQSGLMRILVLVLVLIAPASAGFGSPWRVEHGVLRDGRAALMVFAGDITTRSTIALSCAGGTLRALAAPVPPGARGRVRVTYEIDGRSHSGNWSVEDGHLAAEGDEARRFALRLAAMRSEIWFAIAEGPRSLVSAVGAREAVEAVMAQCRSGS